MLEWCLLLHLFLLDPSSVGLQLVRAIAKLLQDAWILATALAQAALIDGPNGLLIRTDHAADLLEGHREVMNLKAGVYCALFVTGRQS